MVRLCQCALGLAYSRASWDASSLSFRTLPSPKSSVSLVSLSGLEKSISRMSSVDTDRFKKSPSSTTREYVMLALNLKSSFFRFCLGLELNSTYISCLKSDRSRGFGFVTMSNVDEAQACIDHLSGIDLNGRKIRVDFSMTTRPHQSTPGEYSTSNEALSSLGPLSLC